MRAVIRRSPGQGLVEFALILPVALILILAIFDVGRAVFIYNGLTNAAREGARLAIVNQDPILVEQRVQEMATGTRVTNLADSSDPVVTFRRQAPNADPKLNAVCSTIVGDCVAVVTVRTSWTAITPIIGSILGPLALTARSELPVEFVCPNTSVPAYATSAGCPKQP